MALVRFDKDMETADHIMQMFNLRGSVCEMIADAIATERKRCHDIALALDNNRGNEKQIAAAIMYKAVKS